MNQQLTKNPLGYLPIKQLLFSMAWPAIVANLVNAVYNIVDQIFIGHGVGFLGNAATNIAFPITTICLALGLMIGIGSASGFNLELGKGNEEKAKKIVGNAVSFLLILGILICIVIISFLKPLMLSFGATEEILPYAMTFSKITSLGIPFLLILIGLNPIVRADRSPKYSMFAVIVGAVLNIILNPIFIFIFKWGIAGSAWATVISQILSSFLLIFYLPRFKSVKLSKNDFIPSINILKTVSYLGMTSLIFQASNTIIQILTNNLLNKYGAGSIYGSDIPIAIAGIVAKINIVFIGVAIGLVQGAQPIFSFNYGAKQFNRVKEALFLLLKLELIFSSICFIIFEVFPLQIISFFGSGSDLYFDFGTFYMRIFLLMTFVNGAQIAAATFFSSIGKANIGSLLSLIKQLIVLLPLLLLLPHIFEIDGIIYSTPITDFISCIIVFCFIYFEIKNINTLSNNFNNTSKFK